MEPWLGSWNRDMTDIVMQKTAENGLGAAIIAALGSRSIVLVGMMGAGKSSIGRRLATRLNLRFVDADSEIEKAADMTIPEMFQIHGEPYFRAGEARVIARLLAEGPQVLATGGGAFMDANTRALIAQKGVSVWLKADLDVLLRRTKRRGDRPLANRMRELLPQREPIYALADVTIQSREDPHDTIVGEILSGIARPLGVAIEQAEGRA